MPFRLAKFVGTMYLLFRNPSEPGRSLGYTDPSIMEYGSTPYIGMARGKNGRRIVCVQNDTSKLCPRYSHKPLSAIPVILECFHQ